MSRILKDMTPEQFSSSLPKAKVIAWEVVLMDGVQRTECLSRSNPGEPFRIAGYRYEVTMSEDQLITVTKMPASETYVRNMRVLEYFTFSASENINKQERMRLANIARVRADHLMDYGFSPADYLRIAELLEADDG